MISKNKTSINTWPADDRPREKLFRLGEHRLSDSELLAILLRTGRRGASALDVARNILDTFGGFRGMGHTDIRDWQKIKGLGPAKIAQIRAAVEIGRRFGEETLRKGLQVRSAKDIAGVLMPRMRDLKIEIFKAVFCDAQNRVITIEDIEEGTVNCASPVIREIFQRALQRFAVSVICVHNHPSGAVEPSDQDHRFTAQLKEAGRIMQVRLLDHVIIGDNAYFSFADRGLI